MIAKMAKYDFVLYAAQSEDFIEKLRELGLVDITTTGWEPSEEDRQLLLDIEGHTKAADFLRNFRAGEGRFEAGAKPFASGAEAYEHYAAAHQKATALAAEIARLDALVAQAERFAERQQRLVAQGFISKNGADDALAQRDAARAQLATARARSGASRYNLGRSKVVAPVEGVIETQIVAAGDYVKVGDPLYRLVSNRILKAHLPYPESAAARIRPGQPVRLTSAQAPGRVIEGTVEQVKPTVSETSRAIDVQVRLDNDGGLRAGGTVNGAIVTGRKPAAVVVPEQSVVLRPAGKVVYIVADGKARQRIVEPGVKQGGRIEIVKGLAAGELVAEDGAGFLSDGAAVTVKAAPAARPAPAAKP